jgi:GNAT superfamily N-acetyltransferase
MTVLEQNLKASALSLMEEVMRDGNPLIAEYPLVFEERFPGRIVALGEGEKAVSACGTLVREFHMGGVTVRGGLIGSVSTSPERQGQGLGTRLLIEAEAALQQQGCAFALLWAEDPHFYLSRGYCPLGGEDDFSIPTTLRSVLPRATGARPFRLEDAAGIHALYERHFTRLGRRVEETTALLECPGMQTLVLEEEGTIRAYTCMGRGGDLTDAIHEWGGEAEDVLGLVRSHLEQRFGETEDGELFLMAPPSASDLRALLLSFGAHHRRGILGLGKLLDRSAVLQTLKAGLEPEGTVELVETPQGPRFQVTGPDREGVIDDDGALALLFPTAEVSPDVQAFFDGFGFERPRLPLEPFVWGLDSI